MVSNPLKLSELTQNIQRVLGGSFGGKSFWVLAEITNHTFQQNRGYHYFDLVEKEEMGISLKARINGVAWTEGGQKILEFERVTGQKFQNDIQILASVSVDYHPVFGLKLTLLDLDIHYTLGALEQQRQKTLLRLLTECSDFIRKEGDRYITRNNLIPLPRVIQRIAVISSRNSAGYQDFEHTLKHNSFGYSFSLDPYFTQVQGDNHAEGVREKFLEIFRSKIAYDAVFLLRGGGASTDFLLFDTFLLGQIVAKFPIPIITGIGHQKNETLVDLMAHTATKTPTQAAEFLLDHNRAFEIDLSYLRQGIIVRAQKFLAIREKEWNGTRLSVLNHSRDWIQSLNHSMDSLRNGFIRDARTLIHENQKKLWKEGNDIIQMPIRLLSSQKNGIDNLGQRIQTGLKNSFTRNFQNLDHLKKLLRVLSPEQILKRGFALVKKEGKIIRELTGLESGDSLEIILFEEEIKVTLNEKRKRKRNGIDL